MRSATDINSERKPAGRAQNRPAQNKTVVPVIAERARPGVRKVVTGRVRVTKAVHEHEQWIDQTLAREIVDIRRFPKNTIVGGPQPVRETEDLVVIPVVKQAIRVEWILEEEIHLIKRRVLERVRQKVSLRREEPRIESIQSEK